MRNPVFLVLVVFSFFAGCSANCPQAWLLRILPSLALGRPIGNGPNIVIGNGHVAAPAILVHRARDIDVLGGVGYSQTDAQRIDAARRMSRISQHNKD